MKYLIILVLLSSCSTTSEFGQGCRYGLKSLEPQLRAYNVMLKDPSIVSRYCDQVEMMKHRADHLRMDVK